MFTSPRKQFLESAQDVGVYVHFPYCLQKCPYCDFNSHVPKRGQAYAPYTEAVLRELDARLPALAGGRLASIFFGGGTPSLWAPEDVARVIDKIERTLGPAEEITLEANPGAVERGKMNELKSAGVNRVSMGVQALDDKLLRQLGRIHDRQEALEALEKIRETGFASHSIDLIYAVPGQSPADWQTTMAEVVSLEMPHVSAYNLTYEPGTLMNEWRERGTITAVSEDHEAVMFDDTYAAFVAAGLAPYEVSNFARTGHESIHNQLYWRSQPYLGVGAGAHSFTGGVRRAGVKAPAAYVAAWSGSGLAPAPFELEETIAPPTHAHEQLMMGLRTRRGWDAQRSERELGVPALAAARATADQHAEWCVFDGTALRPTHSGLIMNSALVLAASRALDKAATRDNHGPRINRIDGTPLPVTVADETICQAEAAQGGRQGQ
jgi:oxygen-independent coproporphyrinogen-3 oxidase